MDVDSKLPNTREATNPAKKAPGRKTIPNGRVFEFLENTHCFLNQPTNQRRTGTWLTPLIGRFVTAPANTTGFKTLRKTPAQNQDNRFFMRASL